MTIKIETIARIHNAAMQADSWNDLEKRVSDKKDPLLPKKRYRDKEYFALTVAAAHTIMTGKTRENSPCPIDFPATSIELKDTTFHIHGISHDLQHREIMKKIFSRMENAIFESDLSIYYSSKAIDHPRHDEIKYLSFRDIISMLVQPLTVVPQLLDYVLFFRRQIRVDEFGSFRYVDVPGDPDKKTYDTSETTLPDHLAHSWVDYQLGCRPDKALLLQSLAQAQFMEKTGLRMDDDNIHLVVGFRHERHIAYLLQNPETTSEIAQRYQPSLPIRMARALRSPSTPIFTFSAIFPITLYNEFELGIEAIMQGDIHPLGTRILIASVFSAFGFCVAYRKHKHRFTNKMYIKSLFSPKG